jgi:hypothetical protein
VKAAHREHPDHLGLPLRDLRTMMSPELPSAKFFDALLAGLLGGDFAKAGANIRHRNHQPKLPPELIKAGELVRQRLASDLIAPPNKGETATNASEEKTLRFLVNMGEVIEDQHPSSIIEFEGNMTTGILHPTQKPVGLMRYLVETYTNPGDVVLDCFCGSGTTPLAAKQVGRHYLGCDGEVKYVQIARGRLDAEFSFGPLGGGGRGVSVAPATEAKKNEKLTQDARP